METQTLEQITVRCLTQTVAEQAAQIAHLKAANEFLTAQAKQLTPKKKPGRKPKNRLAVAEENGERQLVPATEPAKND